MRDGLTPGLQLPPQSLWSDLSQYWELINLSRAHTPCYGAKGSIEADIHEMSVAASAPHRSTVFRWCIHECKGGRSQCRCTGSPACASKASNQCNSCHDLASERSQVLTVRQGSVKFHSKIGRCSMAGMSPTTDIHVQFSFCLSVVQVNVDDTVLASLNLSRHCFSQDDMMDISWVNVSSIVFQS